MMRAILIALLTLFAATGATAQQRAGQPQISLETLQRVTRELSSDAFEGRAPGTAGETRTVEAIAREFQRAGLQPGNNGSWYLGVYYRVGRELAMGRAWPNWNQGDEFRAIRDRSRAGQ